jgi:hypothetical protein
LIPEFFSALKNCTKKCLTFLLDMQELDKWFFPKCCSRNSYVCTVCHSWKNVLHHLPLYQAKQLLSCQVSK